MIHAWDTYPIKQFPGLWKWMHIQIEQKELSFPRPAYDEMRQRADDCLRWLDNCGPHVEKITDRIIKEAMRIKNLLNIKDDDYAVKGVGENDIFIIAIAHVFGCTLISNEAVQMIVPRVPKNSKIPAVCRMSTVGVKCINILAYIKECGVVFG